MTELLGCCHISSYRATTGMNGFLLPLRDLSSHRTIWNGISVCHFPVEALYMRAYSDYEKQSLPKFRRVYKFPASRDAMEWF
jgi:hypothetical protein